ncbi:MAG: hypothetical protein ABIT76_12145 [Chthoniobacterales bacterium]
MKLWPFLLLLAAPLFAGEPLKLTVENLTFTSPVDWVDVPVTSPMRKATWRTSAGADAAEISFFTFGKDQGGSVNQNIQRWFGQFSESATKGESATVAMNHRTITFARSEGTFTSGMPGGPTTPLPDYALCGAIIETDSGLIFIKMTGPKATVQKLEKTFTEFVTNAAKS